MPGFAWVGSDVTSGSDSGSGNSAAGWHRSNARLDEPCLQPERRPFPPNESLLPAACSLVKSSPIAKNSSSSPQGNDHHEERKHIDRGKGRRKRTKEVGGKDDNEHIIHIGKR